MSEAVSRRMGLDEFWEWQGRQQARYELIDGEPVAMAGAQQQHDRIVSWSRSADRSWAQTILSGLDATLPFSTIGLDMPLSELYSGLDVRLRPRVVPLS